MIFEIPIIPWIYQIKWEHARFHRAFFSPALSLVYWVNKFIEDRTFFFWASHLPVKKLIENKTKIRAWDLCFGRIIFQTKQKRLFHTHKWKKKKLHLQYLWNQSIKRQFMASMWWQEKVLRITHACNWSIKFNGLKWTGMRRFLLNFEETNSILLAWN